MELTPYFPPYAMIPLAALNPWISQLTPARKPVVVLLIAFTVMLMVVTFSPLTIWDTHVQSVILFVFLAAGYTIAKPIAEVFFADLPIPKKKPPPVMLLVLLVVGAAWAQDTTSTSPIAPTDALPSNFWLSMASALAYGLLARFLKAATRKG